MTATMPDVSPAVIAAFTMMTAATIGLIVRGRWRLSIFFVAYALSNVVTVVVYFWPARFYTQAFWILTQASSDILKIGLAIEIGWKTFRRFPGAIRAIRGMALAVIAITIFMSLEMPLTNGRSSSFETALEDFNPRIMDGTIWLIAAMLAVAWFYRVPIHAFHRSVLTLVALYSAFFGTLLRLFGTYTFEVYRPYANAINFVVGAVIWSWWTYLAWRAPTAAERAHLGALRYFQPETSLA